MADNHSKESRSYNMSRIKAKDTKPEQIVRQYLFSHGFRYRKHVSELPGKPDIVLPKYRTVIFVHGCFWHVHENCSRAIIPKSNEGYWIPKLSKNKERDLRNISFLESQGWKVIVVWECELKKNIQLKRLDILYHEILV
jgi:DNA mismatch endonuclease Vsr